MKFNQLYFSILLLLCFKTTFGQTQMIIDSVIGKDTLNMLLGLHGKYWDKIDTPPYYSKIKVVNEGWYFERKQLTLLNYKYPKSNQKKRFEPIEVDLLIGKLKFSLKNDTIIIPQFDSKILIKKLTNDTLIIHDINGGFIGDAIFIKSKDQKQKVEPAIKKVAESKHK